MYSFSYLEPVCCSMTSSNCCFLTCIQVSQEAGQVVWYSHLFQNFPQFIVIHTVKGSGVVNKAEIDVSPLVNTMALGLPVSPGTGLIINTCYRDAYGASLVAQMVKNLSAMQKTGLIPGLGRSPGERNWQHTPVFLPGQRSLAGYSP